MAEIPFVPYLPEAETAAQPHTVNIASAEFRDGAATGIGQLARRLRIVSEFGITLTPEIIETVATETRMQWGGQVFPQDEWL